MTAWSAGKRASYVTPTSEPSPAKPYLKTCSVLVFYGTRKPSTRHLSSFITSCRLLCYFFHRSFSGPENGMRRVVFAGTCYTCAFRPVISDFTMLSYKLLYRSVNELRIIYFKSTLAANHYRNVAVGGFYESSPQRIDRQRPQCYYFVQLITDPCNTRATLTSCYC